MIEKALNIAGISFIGFGLLYCSWSIRNILKGMFLLFFTGWRQWQIDRSNICDICEPETPICPECGCFKKAKAKVWQEKCPLNKWEKPHMMFKK